MNGVELALSQQTLAQSRIARAATFSNEDKPTVADTAHEKVRDMVVAYNRKVDAIRKDDTLSEKGRRSALQQLYEETSLKVDGAKYSGEISTHERSQSLRQTLFGLSPTASDSAVVAHRDAQDRVAQVGTPQDLGELMERAHASGDASLLKAGFAEAYRRSKDALSGDMWDGLVAEYAANHPDKQAALNELDALTTKHARTADMLRRMETSVARPREIR